MAWAFVQTAQNRAGSGTSQSVGAGQGWAAPVAGNVLVAVAACDATKTFTLTGWTKAQEAAGGNLGAALFWKVAAGTETTVSASWSVSASNGLTVLEYSGLAASPLDGSAEDESHVGSVVTSQGSGSYSNTGPGLALAVFVSQNASLTDGSRTYSNSFSERVYNVASNTRPGIAIAELSLSGIASRSCTFGCTDTGDEMYGAIIGFLEPAAIVNPQLMGRRGLTTLARM